MNDFQQTKTKEKYKRKKIRIHISCDQCVLF